MSAPYAPRRTDAGSRFRSVVNEASDVELCRHFLFYGGFAVTAGWILWQIHNNITQGRSGLAAIPIGYGVALIGMGLFFLRRRRPDLACHVRDRAQPRGVPESDASAARHRDGTARERAVSRHVVGSAAPQYLVSLAAAAVWSLGLTVLLLSLFGDYAIILASDLPTISAEVFAAHFPGDAPLPLLDVFSARFQVQGVLMLYLTSLMLMAPVLLALRRWRLPFGSITFMWTLIIASDLVAYQYNRGWTLVAVVLGGLVADYLVLRLRPSGERVGMFRLFAVLATVTLWSLYFVVLAIAYHVGWPAVEAPMPAATTGDIRH